MATTVAGLGLKGAVYQIEDRNTPDERSVAFTRRNILSQGKPAKSNTGKEDGASGLSLRESDVFLFVRGRTSGEGERLGFKRAAEGECERPSFESGRAVRRFSSGSDLLGRRSKLIWSA
jgi:hypothetical protein